MNQHRAEAHTEAPRQKLLSVGGAALLFVFAQVAPQLHEALEAGHDVHACCRDAGTSHLDTCGPDHNAPPCKVCAASRSQVADSVTPETPVTERVEIPAPPPVDFIAVDPFSVDTPDTRGPPA